eukprot:1852460-Pyramimonas_sp.AAC.1
MGILAGLGLIGVAAILEHERRGWVNGSTRRNLGIAELDTPQTMEEGNLALEHRRGRAKLETFRLALNQFVGASFAELEDLT